MTRGPLPSAITYSARILQMEEWCCCSLQFGNNMAQYITIIMHLTVTTKHPSDDRTLRTSPNTKLFHPLPHTLSRLATPYPTESVKGPTSSDEDVPDERCNTNYIHDYRHIVVFVHGANYISARSYQIRLRLDVYFLNMVGYHLVYRNQVTSVRWTSTCSMETT